MSSRISVVVDRVPILIVSTVWDVRPPIHPVLFIADRWYIVVGWVAFVEWVPILIVEWVPILIVEWVPILIVSTVWDVRPPIHLVLFVADRWYIVFWSCRCPSCDGCGGGVGAMVGVRRWQ